MPVRPVVEKEKQGMREEMIYLATYRTESREADREREHRLGRMLLEAGLMREYGRTWEASQDETGRPCLKGAPSHVDFNISHTQGLVVCAVSGCRVGVDAELIRPVRERLCRRVLAEEERELLERTVLTHGEGAAAELFTRLWTLKESYGKATGAGLGYPLRETAFIRRSDGAWEGNTPGFVYEQTKVYGRYIISLCLGGQGNARPAQSPAQTPAQSPASAGADI